MRTTKGPSAYILREIAELALLIGVLAAVSQFVYLPVWVFVGIPLAKLFASLAMYILFLRRTFLRPTSVGPEALVGQTAETITPLDPSGQVKVNGEIWSALSQSGTTIPAEQKVKILEVRGNTLHVASPTYEG